MADPGNAYLVRGNSASNGEIRLGSFKITKTSIDKSVLNKLYFDLFLFYKQKHKFVRNLIRIQRFEDNMERLV